MNPIGVMQGRLSPPAAGRIQSFPVDSWGQEFPLAREAGLSCIEWIYEAGTDALNPLASAAAISEVHALSQHHGVGVWSVCADYYMERPLLTSEGLPNEENAGHLAWLISQAAQLGCRHIVLPFVDASRLATSRHAEGLRRVLDRALPVASHHKVELHLETDLEPAALGALLRAIGHPGLRANLDLGNSASLGHDPRTELAHIGPWLGSVHVKDRLRGGGTVPLGHGDTDLATYFALLAELDYQGALILQVARSSKMSEVEWCRRSRATVEGWLQPYAPVSSGQRRATS